MLTPHVLRSFSDELIKISVSKQRMTIAQSRSGRRPMSVDTMLRKEKEGSLYKYTKQASCSGQCPVEYQEIDPDRLGGKPANPKAKKGDIPSREDVPTSPKAENRQDAQSATMHHTERFNPPEGLSAY